MKIMVTGGTGFIGSHLVDALLDAGHQVVCATRGGTHTAPLSRRRVELIPIDELTQGSYDLEGTDALYHLAAVRHRWGASKADYLTSNVDLTRRLLERAEGRVEQFIYCSSIAVFGWPPRGPIDESFPYDPINAYGKSKVLCEQMVLKWHRERRLRGTIVRPSITYGLRDSGGMLTKLAVMIDRGIYATVGSGENRVQLAHVSDIVQGLLKVLAKPRAYGRCYIITSRSPIHVNRLVELVAEQLGKPRPRWRVSRPAAYAAALGLEALYALGWKVTGPEPMIAREKIQVMTADRHYSIARAEAEVGYSPQYDYEQGIADFVSGLRQEGLIGRVSHESQRGDAEIAEKNKGFSVVSPPRR